MKLRLLCRAVLCGVFTSVLLLPGVVAKGAEWKRVKETSDGIVVHTREAPGTNVLAIMSTVEINAKPNLVLDAACDPKTFRKSLEYVEENKFFYSKNPNVWFNYQMLNFPIITRRDYTVRYERTEEPSKSLYRLSWRLSDKIGPKPRDGVIRITLAKGYLDVIPISGGSRSKIEYHLLTDPGGRVPAWIVNLANKVSVPTLMREIRDESLRRMRKSFKEPV